jgi:hypothetical protein
MICCQVCGATEARTESVSELFLVDGLRVLVEVIDTFGNDSSRVYELAVKG